jgi:hypothetical protein
MVEWSVLLRRGETEAREEGSEWRGDEGAFRLVARSMVGAVGVLDVDVLRWDRGTVECVEVVGWGTNEGDDADRGG